MVVCGTQEKFRERVAKRGSHDQFRGRESRANRAQPRAEGTPHELGEFGGQILKQSLRDDARVNEEMVGVDLAFDGISIVVRFPMQVLVAVASTQPLHVPHPEMIREGADNANRLLEAVFDLEAQAIETNDVDATEGCVGGHQQATSSGGMNDHDEAYQPSNGPPEQITDSILDGDVFLAVDGTLAVFHRGSIVEQ